MKTFDKLRNKIKNDLDIDLLEFRRMYVGHWQRSAGAFVWCAIVDRRKDGSINHYDIGSTFSATELLKQKKPLIISRDGEVLPDN